MLPINILAEALHAAECGCGSSSGRSRDYAQVFAVALTDAQIVDNAVNAVIAAGWNITTPLDWDHLRGIVRAAFESVGGGA